MKFRIFSGLKGRMLLSIGSAVSVGLLLIVVVVAQKVSENARRDAMELSRRQADLVGHEANQSINEAMAIARSMADALSGLTQGGGVPSRAAGDAILRNAVSSNAELMGAWTVWEPNAFDGQDEQFVNKPGHDATGRYVPYWNRASGSIAVEPTKDYTVAGAGDFYLSTKKLNRETVIEPYLYSVAGREVMITTLAVPIRDRSGAVVGVTGVDLALQTMAERIAKMELGESAYAALISSAGAYVVHPNTTRIGKPMVDSDPWVKPHLEEIRNGRSFTTEAFSGTLKSNAFRVASPLPIGRSGTSWSAIITTSEAQVLASSRRLAGLVAGIGACVLLVVLAVVFWLAGRISRPICEMADSLLQGADHMAAASTQTASAAQSLARGATEQAASLEETGASCEEMASMTKRNEEHAANAKALATESRAAAEGGVSDMREMATAMTELKAASASVAKIVQTIDEIAFQTNILALNAAVEAARAGEAGMGFAVVAEEVRNLAQRSASAAKETATTIETTIQRSERGFALSEKVSSRLAEMAGKARRVDDHVAEISRASTEQSQGINQINVALSQMDKITQDTAAQAEETASASEEQSAQAEVLKETVGRLLALVEGGAAASAAGSAPSDRKPYFEQPDKQVRAQRKSATVHAPIRSQQAESLVAAEDGSWTSRR